MYVRGIRRLFRFPGYVVDKITLDVGMAQVNLRLDKRRRLECPACGASLGGSRTVRQTARDLPLGLAFVVVVVYEAVQGHCSACETWATLHPPGIGPRAKATDRLMAFVSFLCKHLPVRRVESIVGVSKATVRRWDKAWLAKCLPPPNLDALRFLLIDEKSVRRRHGYVTLVMNAESGELLFMAEGKKKSSLEAFLNKLNDAQKARIEAVAMDRNGAYYEVVRDELPEAEIVLDKFHLVANFQSVVDEVRRQEWRHAEGQFKNVVKGQRYNLLRNPENLTEEQAARLSDLLALNAKIHVAYVLKEAFRHLWTYTRRAWAAKYLARWTAWAQDSAIEPIRRFVRNLEKWKDGVLAYFKYPITNAPLEAFNATVSRIIYRSCGVQDMDYLFLKLRQESLRANLQT